MAESLGRWRCWDDNRGFPTSRVAAGPPQSTEGEAHEHHVHIHIGDEALSRSGATRSFRRDNAGDPGQEVPAARRNGNGPNGAQPRVLARLLQSGEDGSWAATDGEGNPLVVRTANDGALEVIHHPDYEEQNGDADPKAMGIERPLGSATLDSYRAFDERALDELRRTGTTRDAYAASRAFAAQMSAAFRPKNR